MKMPEDWLVGEGAGYEDIVSCSKLVTLGAAVHGDINWGGDPVGELKALIAEIQADAFAAGRKSGLEEFSEAIELDLELNEGEPVRKRCRYVMAELIDKEPKGAS